MNGRAGQLVEVRRAGSGWKGLDPVVLEARAGHSDFATTQRYIDLAGEHSEKTRGSKGGFGAKAVPKGSTKTDLCRPKSKRSNQ